MPVERGESFTLVCRTTNTTLCFAMLHPWTPPNRLACTSEPAADRCTPAPTRARPLLKWPRTCRTCCACVPPSWWETAAARSGMHQPAPRYLGRPVLADFTVVLPGVLQPLVGGQSYLTASADGAVTVGQLLDSVTGEYPVLARRLRDE